MTNNPQPEYLTELDIPKPEIKRRISALEVLQGTVVSALDKVNLMEEDEYEKFTLEWVDEYLNPKYTRVRSFAGAGDKGRDVVGYYSDDNIDIFQCKHYDSKISPTTLYPELGKLCYYTFTKQYKVPKAYYIVSPKGCGPDVLDMIEKPSTINALLINNWEKYCKSKITKKALVELKDDFKKYVEDFNFSIIRDVAPHELIEQHKQTSHYIIRFGGGIKKYRDVIPVPDEDIQTRELIYTTMLFEVYQEKTGGTISNEKELETSSPELLKHFKTQRNSFYSAESLDKFSRENFPDAEPLPFSELKDDAESVLSTTLELNNDKPGYERVLLASQEIKRQTFSSNALTQEIKPLDKDGLCHHLANEERLKWIIK